MRYFTPSHEWIEINGKTGMVGITDHAQKELGDIVFIELPKLNQIVNAGEEISVLESTKAAADIYTPVSGKIIAINDAVKNTPSLINESAEKNGWLYKIELSNPSETNRLLTSESYKKLI